MSIDAGLLTTATKWLEALEMLSNAGPLPPRKKAEKLISLYRELERFGGEFPPDRAAALIAEARGEKSPNADD